ncbi:MAG: mannitol-1-phosphate 5-dehydrogenase, partial [Alphaproteobacteria bacterium]|nr:mannitol-1-phosphate 5-dehydrogenase [Alphaproteobacteria bacterium]
DPATVDVAKAATGRDDAYFAVPDVITSNTAPEALLADDPLAVVTEDGELFVDEACGLRFDAWRTVPRKELDDQWTAKLYLHNTPHCVAAYLGARIGATYLHESMAHPGAEKIVRGSMHEMLNALKLRWEISHDFLDWYADKELARFANHLLCDPISRVAREPLRKLDLDGRLIGAARICLSHGILPHNLLLGIASALLFDDPRDDDRQMAFLRRALDADDLLTLVLGLTRGEALELVLRDQLANLEAGIRRLHPPAAPEVR